MNHSLKIFIKIYLLFFVNAVHAAGTTRAAIATPGGDPMGGGELSWYTDEFGPLRSNYSMGDLARYDATQGNVAPVMPINGAGNQANGYNIYYGSVQFPYASDVYNYNNNAYNLYNFIGNLYAGYAALNISPAANTKSQWLENFRKSGQWMSGSLGFDNNPTASYTIQLVNEGRSLSTFAVAAGGLGNSGISVDQGLYFLNPQPQGSLANANASCAWNTNVDFGNYVLARQIDSSYYVPPYGQFFGARLSHILGAVVNDVPAESNNTKITSMPSGTPVPQMAVFTGGPAAYAGATTPSTAHFGTMQKYLTNISSASSTVFSGIKKLQRFSYLINHLLPTVTRFATGGPAAAAGTTPSTTPLCSYTMGYTSDNRNLIAINSSAVTAYDNGVIVDVQNNTGDKLTVKQVTATGNNVIGTLDLGTNNYFLHTASLMNLPAGSTATLPVQTNMIEIKDASINASDIPSIFISVVTAAQAEAIMTPINAALGVLSPATGTPGTTGYTPAGALIYNVGNFLQSGSSAATPSATAQYLLMTNFNPNVPVVSNLAGAYRLQAIDVSQFNGMPYFVTLQISKENLQFGLNMQTTPVSMDLGTAGTSMLLSSIVSVKTCSWTNPYAVAQKLPYSQIPLLLIPDSVLNLKSQGYALYGLQAHYGIWLMAYAAALTEFSFGCNFGDNIGCVGNTFGLFDVTQQAAPARAVIDANGYLASGQSLVLQTSKQKQSAGGYLSLIGCDVWDNGANQDIPMLYLYQNAQGQIVANQHASAQTVASQPANQTKVLNMINFSVTFKNMPGKSKSASAFAQGYGQPYHKTMLFALPAATMATGVTATLTQPVAGSYLLTFTDQNKNVLAFQKVYVSSAPTSMVVNFLPTPDGNWNSPVTMPVGSVPVGQSQTFGLNYVRANGKNSLTAANQQATQALANITSLVGAYTSLVQQNMDNLQGTYTMEDITNAYNAAMAAINSAIQTYPTLEIQLKVQLNSISQQQQGVQNSFNQQQQQQPQSQDFQQSQQSQQMQPYRGGF